jgi:signal transduction histidine kinase
MRRPGEGFEEAAGQVLLHLAILELIDADASDDELRKGLRERNLPCDAASLAAAVSRLERQGLMRAGDAPGSPPALTAAGRRARDRVAASLEHHRSGEAAADRERAALAAERAELERLRADFLATVSHELRTPLTLVRTSIGLLLDGDPDAAMRERLLRNIKQGTDRLQALVADLLDLARLRNLRVALNLRRVDLGELASGVAALMTPLLAGKDQRLDVAVPDPAPCVLGDYRRLERVLVNLLANAHKFAPRGARVAITVAAEHDGASVAVSDTGPGIAPEAQARLWEQFYTGRTSSSSHDIGVGLGLPIAQGIVEAHGGRIWVESVVGEGSTFRFALPAEPPQGEGAE